MKRNSTAAMAAGAILGGALIGAGGTLVLLANAVGHAGGESLECTDVEVREANAVGHSWWFVTPGGEGHRVHVGKSPGGGWRYRFRYDPVHRHGTFTMESDLVRLRAGQLDVVSDAADAPSWEEPKRE